MHTDNVDQFEVNRARMFGLAYRMLGEAAEAEDVVQDAFLRWHRSENVCDPGAWLTKVVSNLCLSRLTSARLRRESYVGPWLPEPVFTANGAFGPLDTVELRDSLSFGMLVLLERLTPPERAAFVLRTAFGHSHREIARLLDLEEVHVRQLYQRARGHVGRERQRFNAEPEHSEAIVARFIEAAGGGDLDALTRQLAEDVVASSDGGGKATAARRPIVGRDKVVRYFSGLGTHPRAMRAVLTMNVVNAAPAITVHEAGVLSAIVVPEVEDDVVVAIRTVINPEKLAFASRQGRHRGRGGGEFA